MSNLVATAADVNKLIQKNSQTGWLSVQEYQYVNMGPTGAQGFITNISSVGSSPPAPKKKRQWTGNPRGKNQADIERRMRLRRSYEWFVREAKIYREAGVPWDVLPFHLKRIHQMKRDFKVYRYNSNAWYASQSLELICRDIQDFDKREKLGLN